MSRMNPTLTPLVVKWKIHHQNESAHMSKIGTIDSFFYTSARVETKTHNESDPNPSRSSSSWVYHLQKNSDKKDDGMTSYGNKYTKPLPSTLMHKIINWNCGHCTQRPRYVRIHHRVKCSCGQQVIQLRFNHRTATQTKKTWNRINHKPRTHDTTWKWQASFHQL